MKIELATLLLFHMTSIFVEGVDLNDLRELIPKPFRDELSDVLLSTDQIISSVIEPFQPALDVVQKYVVPPDSALAKEAERIYPLLHNIICYRSKHNISTLLLFTPRNPEEGYILRANDTDSLIKSQYDPDLPIKIIIHGFIFSRHSSNEWMIAMKDALLKQSNYNVILVDWSCGNFLPYHRAVKNSKEVAREIAKLLTALENFFGEAVGIHIIGHSLGAQMAGFIGRITRNLNRISGLDPAGPEFVDPENDLTLSLKDAEFVDIIHTDGAQDLVDGFGYTAPTGHVDFYPSGGEKQKGCLTRTIQEIINKVVSGDVSQLLFCNHLRAIDYYLESITQAMNPYGCQFVGVKCRDWKEYEAGRCGGCEEPGSCAFMGFNADFYDMDITGTPPNKFYLRVNPNPPFCDSKSQPL